MGSRPFHTGGVVAVAGALPMEVGGIKRLGSFSRARLDGMKYMRGVVRQADVALFVSGMGGECAYQTARAACDGLPVAAYVSVGLSGSLSPVLNTGDVVVGVKVAEPSGREYLSDRELAGIAMSALSGEAGTLFGSLLALDRVASSSRQKRDLAESYNCVAVDMETAGAARAAGEAGVPFIAIRAISDALGEDMPVDFNRFSSDGGMDWPRFVMHVLTHPGTIQPLVRLGRNSRMAAGNIARAAGPFIEALARQT